MQHHSLVVGRLLLQGEGHSSLYQEGTQALGLEGGRPSEREGRDTSE